MPIECGPLAWVESCRHSAIRQLRIVTRWLVAAGPSSRGPETLRFSSVAQVTEQCLDQHVMGLAAGGRDTIRFPAAPLRLGLASPGPDPQVLNDHVVRLIDKPPRMIVMPGDGAVCPAIGDARLG
jgi:hypothetical protein